VLPALIQTVNDPIPRVQSHSLAALGNFIEGAENAIVKHYATKIMETVIGSLEKGVSLVKECSLQVVTSCGEKLGKEFNQFSGLMIPALMKILGAYNQKEYKLFRGQAIECLCTILNSVGIQAFGEGNVKQLIQYLYNIQQNHLEAENDPQKAFILNAW
jgi:importin-5